MKGSVVACGEQKNNRAENKVFLGLKLWNMDLGHKQLFFGTKPDACDQERVKRKDHLLVAFEGNCFNTNEIIQQFGLEAKSVAGMILELYEIDKLFEALPLLNGVFGSTIIDEQRSSISLITDRFGFFPLYFNQSTDNFSWAGDVTSLLRIDPVSTAIDELSIQCYLDVGHLLGNVTFFKGIQHLPPATITQFDANTGMLSSTQYWSWKDIQSVDVSFEEAVQRTGELLLTAVSRRFTPTTGISLSGGLDSRLILAAIKTNFANYKGFAYTFGKENSIDRVIAQRVAKVADWRHKFFEINTHNWFQKRLGFVLRTDGMENILDLHGSEFIEEIGQEMQVNLNGFLGDLILGGTYAAISQEEGKRRVIKEYGKYSKLFDLDSLYFDRSKPDAYTIFNRGRRFTNLGLVSIESYVEQRRPFVDNDLMSFLYGLPVSYRLNHRLFTAVALQFFPAFFKKIPRDKTRVPIAMKHGRRYHIRRRYQKMLEILHLVNYEQGYTNYSEWMNEPNAKKLMMDTILDRKNIVNQFVTQKQRLVIIDSFRQGKPEALSAMGRLFTLYYYFDNVFLKP